MKRNLRLLPFAVMLLVAGCVSAPHEVVTLHEKQGAMMQELKRTHLAMIDAYVDEKLQTFERFYFEKYGPVYRKNWEADFNAKMGRDYDAGKDFALFYND